MLKPYEVDLITKNIEQVFKKKDIDILSQKSYEFLMLMSGFIVHYDLGGFKYAYHDLRYLVRDILASRDSENPERYINDEFFAKSYGIDYCKSKTATIINIRTLASMHKSEIDMIFQLDESSRELTEATKIAEKHGYKLVRS